ncbi:MAG: RDD family protein [Chitinophagales bacterium]|nr:RDD family protein [Chitinophagales bacterium]
MEEDYPSLMDRIQSTFIDTVFNFTLVMVVSGILDNYNLSERNTSILLIGLFLLYEPVCITLGCTLGNLIKGIRVRKFTDHTKRPNLIQAIIRYAAKFLLGWFSLLTINGNPERRAIHDMASDSIMIRKETR